MPIQDPQIKSKPPVWKIVLNYIYTALTAAKNAGLFNKKAGPK